MAQMLVRNIEETVKRQIKKRAKANHRSMEAEVREILREAVGFPNRRPSQGGEKGLGTLFHSYFKDLGGVDFEPLPRERHKT